MGRRTDRSRKTYHWEEANSKDRTRRARSEAREARGLDWWQGLAKSQGVCAQCNRPYKARAMIRWTKGQQAVHAGACYLLRRQDIALSAVPPLVERRRLRAERAE